MVYCQISLIYSYPRIDFQMAGWVPRCAQMAADYLSSLQPLAVSPANPAPPPPHLREPCRVPRPALQPRGTAFFPKTLWG
jgi:hypothetical protein